MKLKRFCLLSGVLIALFATNIIPTSATDFSGYVQAAWCTQVQWGDRTHRNSQMIQGGTAWMVLEHWWIENVGDVPLIDAIYLVEVVQLSYYDEEGVLHTVTDPVELAQLVRVRNSDEMWQDSYVVWLGTINPGFSKKVVTNFWVGVSNWTVFGSLTSVWYLL